MDSGLRADNGSFTVYFCRANDVAPFRDFGALELGELFRCAADEVETERLGTLGDIGLVQRVRISCCKREMMTVGVPARTTMPYQFTTSKFGSVSFAAGTSGKCRHPLRSTWSRSAAACRTRYAAARWRARRTRIAPGR